MTRADFLMDAALTHVRSWSVAASPVLSRWALSPPRAFALWPAPAEVRRTDMIPVDLTAVQFTLRFVFREEAGGGGAEVRGQLMGNRRDKRSFRMSITGAQSPLHRKLPRQRPPARHLLAYNAMRRPPRSLVGQHNLRNGS